MLDSALGVGIVQIGGALLGSRGRENHWTSGSKSPHVESSWRLNYLTEGTVAIEVGSLFNN